MTNKKGGTIIRLILVILLTTIFSIFVIFVLKAIKDKNKITTTKDNIKMVTPTEYNPVNDIYTYNIMSYKNSNFLNNSTYQTNIFNYESNNNVYYISMTENGENVNNYSSGYYPIAYEINKNSNRVNIGRDLYAAHYYQRGLISWNGVQSWAICYNCNIPVESFNFTMYYNFPINTNTTPLLYIYTDNGAFRTGILQFSTSNLNANFSSSIITSNLPSATKVLRFGFGFAQSSNSNNLDNYLPTSAGTSSATNGINYYNNDVYRNYFNTLSDVQKDNTCYISFATETYPIDYTEGYNEGVRVTTNELNNTINSLNSNIITLQNEINNLNSTISSQQIIITNLQEQVNNANNNFKGLFFTIADIPFKTISNALGFEALGVNLFNFFVGVITALGMIWLIRKIWL